VLLAGGASQRLGQPKALAPLPLGTPLERLAKAAGATFPTPPLLVTGHHHAELTAAVHAARLDVEIVHNPRWAQGRTTSVQAAAEHSPGCSLVLLPIDHPRIRATLLERLVSTWLELGGPPRGWLAPSSRVHFGPNDELELSESRELPLQPGHPICVGRELIALLFEDLNAWAARPLRDLRVEADPLWSFEVKHSHDALAIHENLDTPEDLARISARDVPPTTS